MCVCAPEYVWVSYVFVCGVYAKGACCCVDWASSSYFSLWSYLFRMKIQISCYSYNKSQQTISYAILWAAEWYLKPFLTFPHYLSLFFSCRRQPQVLCLWQLCNALQFWFYVLVSISLGQQHIALTILVSFFSVDDDNDDGNNNNDGVAMTTSAFDFIFIACSMTKCTLRCIWNVSDKVRNVATSTEKR